MAKRLTDTNKWKNPWFRKLPTDYKILFLYILDECDNVGVLHIDPELISYTIKIDISVQGMRDHLSDKISFLSNDKVIVKNFMSYQNNLNSPRMQKHLDGLLVSHRIKERFESGEFQ